MVEAPSNETDILSFEFAEQTGVATPDTATHTVEIAVSYGTRLNGLIPTIIHSEGSTLAPASEVARDFSSDVSYTVTAADGTLQDWVVTTVIGSPILATSRDEAFKLYPNPVSEVLSIEWSAFQAGDHMKITDVSGKVVLGAQPIVQGHFELDISFLPSGMYCFHHLSRSGQQTYLLLKR